MLSIRGLRKTYAQVAQPVAVFSDLSLDIQSGDMVALMGSSGEGKTTLLQILGCLDRPDGGEYWLAGRELSRLPEEELAAVRNRQIGFVFQSSYFVDYLNLVENVALPGLYGEGVAGRAGERRAGQLLDEVGLGHRKRHVPAELSGGERQRAAIARALFNRPDLLLADEPTGNLDAENTRQVMSRLAALNEDGLTVLLVTHDESVASYARRVLELAGGELRERPRAGV
jgi:putative ABC transport system ATP-binding protein